MIKEINMPMMAPEGSSSSVSELTWDDIPSAGPCDIQSGRNVYIELNEDQTCTKASAGKILQFIKEGFMPVAKLRFIENGSLSDPPVLVTDFHKLTVFEVYGVSDSVVEFILFDSYSDRRYYAYPDALDKPFTSIARNASANSIR